MSILEEIKKYKNTIVNEATDVEKAEQFLSSKFAKPKTTKIGIDCKECGKPKSAYADVRGGKCAACHVESLKTPEQKEKDKKNALRNRKSEIRKSAWEDAQKCWFDNLPKERQEEVLRKQAKAMEINNAKMMHDYLDPSHRFESKNNKKKIIEGYKAHPVSHSNGITYHKWQDGSRTIKMNVYDNPRGEIKAKISMHLDTGGDEAPMPETKNFRSYEAAMDYLRKHYGI